MKADGDYWHVDGQGDQLVSTRYQTDDAFSRFRLIGDGAVSETETPGKGEPEVIDYLDTSGSNPHRFATPQTVTLPGTFQTMLGCQEEWQPDCWDSYLINIEDGKIWAASYLIPPGEYHYRVALNETWAENYGRDGIVDGPDISLTVDFEEETPVTFVYNHTLGRVFDSVNYPDLPAVGKLVETRTRRSDTGSGPDPDCEQSEEWSYPYEVQEGDTITSVAEQYQVPESRLISENCIKNQIIRPGDQLHVPLLLEESLNRLGVRTNNSPRMNAEGEVLPDTYSPLGLIHVQLKPAELFVMGVPFRNQGSDTLIAQDLTGVEGEATLETLARFDAGGLPESRTSYTVGYDARVQRSVAAADIDSDGREEILIAYLDTNPSSTAPAQLRVIDDQRAGFPVAPDSYYRLHPNFGAYLDGPWKDIALAAGDLDGNGTIEIVYALSSEFTTQIYVHEFDEQGILQIRDFQPRRIVKSVEVVFEERRNIGVAPSPRMLFAEVKLGNLDYDPALETLVVFNELRFDGTTEAVPRYAVYDGDELRPYREPGALSPLPVAVGDAALGDIDGDGLDEIVTAAIEAFQTDGCAPSTILMTAMDDIEHGLAMFPLGADALINERVNVCVDEDPFRLRYLRVNTANLDGDPADEFHVNQYVFDDFVEGEWRRWDLGIWEENLFDNSGIIDRSTFTMETGDASGDGHEDIIVYSQGGDSYIGVYGVPLTDPRGTLRQLAYIPTGGADEDFTNPIVLPVNVDDDAAILEYAFEHEFVFTEPVIVAILAAPPCHAAESGVNQSIDRCRTGFATSTARADSEETAYTVSGELRVGVSVEAPIPGIAEVELVRSFSIASTMARERSSSFSTSVARETGNMENSIIFTSIPVDRYKYTVIAHPDRENVGKTMYVDLPREPVTLKTTVEYYNERVARDNLRISDGILTHTIGDPGSYRTVTEKNQLVRDFNGVESRLAAVGQAGSSASSQTQITIELTEESALRNALAIDTSISLDATLGGIIGGVTIGAGTENTIQVSVSEGTAFIGTVGDLIGDDLEEHGYRLGMFAYVYEVPTSQEEFWVVDYWVQD